MTEKEYIEQLNKRCEAYAQGLDAARDMVLSVLHKTENYQKREVLIELCEKLRLEAKSQRNLRKEAK
jgi:hypothetical protein